MRDGAALVAMMLFIAAFGVWLHAAAEEFAGAPVHYRSGVVADVRR